ncbi:MAG: hypothetical protein JWQ75_2357, partial [Pseudarthrobacter sp.]|nr:hypothetical protein [Pseudarthrobacter sp.]
LERLLREVDSAAGLDSGPSRIQCQLEHVARTVKGRLLLFVVADELTASPDTEQLLRRLRAQHEILWLTIRDADLAGQGSTRQDAFNVTDSSVLPGHLATSPAITAAYAKAAGERDAGRQAMFRRTGIAQGHVSGSSTVLAELFALLERHRRAG